jgi:hypothetical protein
LHLSSGKSGFKFAFHMQLVHRYDAAQDAAYKLFKKSSVEYSKRWGLCLSVAVTITPPLPNVRVRACHSIGGLSVVVTVSCCHCHSTPECVRACVSLDWVGMNHSSSTGGCQLLLSLSLYSCSVCACVSHRVNGVCVLDRCDRVRIEAAKYTEMAAAPMPAGLGGGAAGGSGAGGAGGADDDVILL